MPGLFFFAPAIRCHETGNRFGFLSFGFLGNLYKAAVITAWCLGVFYVFATMAHNKSVLPMMIWSYAVASSPIIWLGQKDQECGGNEYSAYFVFFVMLAYITVAVMALFGQPTLPETITTFAMIMGAGTVFISAFYLSTERADRMLK